jgi:hypothetical protein
MYCLECYSFLCFVFSTSSSSSFFFFFFFVLFLFFLLLIFSSTAGPVSSTSYDQTMEVQQGDYEVNNRISPDIFAD